MVNDQQQQTALVTGSNKGIGEAIVKSLAKLNYKLVVTGRDGVDVARVAQECAKLSPSKTKPLEVVANFERESDVERLFQLTMVHFNGRLDLLVNNAGTAEPAEPTESDQWYNGFKRVMQVNLNAAVRLTTLASTPLKETALKYCKGKPTCVLMIGSIAAAQPTQTRAVYSTSKAAMTMFAKCCAWEMAPLVRVNCLQPGPVVTKILERTGFSVEQMQEASKRNTPLRRVGQVDEIAEAAMFLVDQQRACFITGAELTIDGGTLTTPLRWKI